MYTISATYILRRISRQHRQLKETHHQSIPLTVTAKQLQSPCTARSIPRSPAHSQACRPRWHYCELHHGRNNPERRRRVPNHARARRSQQQARQLTVTSNNGSLTVTKAPLSAAALTRRGHTVQPIQYSAASSARRKRRQHSGEHVSLPLQSANWKLLPSRRRCSIPTTSWATTRSFIQPAPGGDRRCVDCYTRECVAALGAPIHR